MLYSSGRRAGPKAFDAHSRAALRFGRDPRSLLGGIMGFKEGDVYLNPAPLYHSAPLAWSMTAHRIGAPWSSWNGFDPRIASISLRSTA